MKQKTSVSLSAEVLDALDELGGEAPNRSRIIEEAVVEYLERRKRQQRENRDRQILDSVADDLNREMEDVLGYQVEL